MALLVPRFPKLKEWAYAGIFFNMTAAAASHAFSSDNGPYAFHLIAPAFLAVLAVASRILLPQSTTPGALVPAGNGLTASTYRGLAVEPGVVGVHVRQDPCACAHASVGAEAGNRSR
jgi:DoxX-like family